MSHSTMYLFITGFAAITLAIIIWALNKSGIISGLVNGKLWDQGQEGLQKNDVSY